MAARDSDNILGDVVEALIGALYLDRRHRRRARTFIERHWGEPDRRRSEAPRNIPSRRCRNGPRRATASRPIIAIVARERAGPCAAFHRRRSASQARARRGRRHQQAGGRNGRAHGSCSPNIGGTKIMTHRCGLVAVVGAPNAGKSTLVNALVGQKVAIVSPKAQTTRTRLMGIAMDGETQIMLVDTPGIFAPNRRLDRAMVARGVGRRRQAPTRSLWWSMPRRARPSAPSDSSSRLDGPARAQDPGAQQGRYAPRTSC